MTVKKTATGRKCGTTKKAADPVYKKGDTYICGTCGLAVTVDEACGCVGVHEIICCGKAMKPRKAKVKAAAAKKNVKAAARKK